MTTSNVDVGLDTQYVGASADTSKIALIERLKRSNTPVTLSATEAQSLGFDMSGLEIEDWAEWKPVFDPETNSFFSVFSPTGEMIPLTENTQNQEQYEQTVQDAVNVIHESGVLDLMSKYLPFGSTLASSYESIMGSIEPELLDRSVHALALETAIEEKFVDSDLITGNLQEDLATLREALYEDPDSVLYKILEGGWSAESEALLREIAPELTEADIEAMFGWEETMRTVLPMAAKAFPGLNIAGLRALVKDPDSMMKALYNIGKNPNTLQLYSVYNPDADAQDAWEFFEGEEYDEGWAGKTIDAIQAGVGDFGSSVGAVLKWTGLESTGDNIMDYWADWQDVIPPDQGYGWDFVRSLPTTLWMMAASAGIGGAIPTVFSTGTKMGALGNYLLKTTGMGVTSRFIESTMEGAQAREQAIQLGYSKSEANKIGTNVLANNMKLVGLDVIQYSLGFMPMLKIGGKTVTSMINKGLFKYATKGVTYMGVALTEGGEEYFQTIVTKQAMGEDINVWAVGHNLSDEEIRGAFVVGMMSGLFFAGAGEAAGIAHNSIKRIQDSTIKNLPTDVRNDVVKGIAEDMRDNGTSLEQATYTALSNEELLSREDVQAVVEGAIKVAEVQFYTDLIRASSAEEAARIEEKLRNDLAETGLESIPDVFIGIESPSVRAQRQIAMQREGEFVSLSSEQSTQLNKDISASHNENGGATFSTDGRNLAGEPLFSVSIYEGREQRISGKDITPEIMEVYRSRNTDILSQEGNAIGTWYDSETNLSYIDVVVTVPTKTEAIKLGLQHNQVAVFDLKNMREIYTAQLTKAQLRHYGAEGLDIIDPAFMSTGQQGSEGRIHRDYADEFREGKMAERAYMYTEEQVTEPRFEGKPKYEIEYEGLMFDPRTASDAEVNRFNEKVKLVLDRMKNEYGQFFGTTAEQKTEIRYQTAKELGYDGYNSGTHVVMFEPVTLTSEAENDARRVNPVVSLSSINALEFELKNISKEIYEVAKITPKQLQARIIELRGGRPITRPDVVTVDRPTGEVTEVPTPDIGTPGRAGVPTEQNAELINQLRTNLSQTEKTGEAIAILPDGTGLAPVGQRDKTIFHHDLGGLPPSSEWVNAGVARIAWERGGKLSIEININQGITQSQYDRLAREINRAEQVFIDITDNDGNVVTSYDGSSAEMIEAIGRAKEIRPTYQEDIITPTREAVPEIGAPGRAGMVEIPDAITGEPISKERPVTMTEVNRALKTLVADTQVRKTMMDEMYGNIAAQKIAVIKNEINMGIKNIRDFYRKKNQRLANLARGRYSDAKAKAKADKQAIYSMKVELVKYVRENLPVSERGRLITQIRDVDSMQKLNESAAKVEIVFERYARRVLKIRVMKELAATKPSTRGGYPVGKYTPEGHRLLTTIEANLTNITRDEARAMMAENAQASIDGKMNPELAYQANQMLRMAGIKDMTSSELQYALDTIKSIKETGSLLKAEKQSEKQAKIEEDNTTFLNTITAGKGLKPGTGKVKAKQLEAKPHYPVAGEKLSAFLESLINRQYGLYDILDKLDQHSKTDPGKGPLATKFKALIHKAHTTESLGVEKASADVRENFKKIYGVEGTRAMEKELQAMNEEHDLGSFPETEGQPLMMSRNQAMKIWQWAQDPTLDSTFREGMGWSDKMLYAVADILTDADIAWAQYQMDFYQEYYESVNGVYKEMYGIDMPRNYAYSPVVREDFQSEPEHILMLNELNEYASVKNGSLRMRTANINPLDIVGANEVLMNHISQMEHFKAWASPINELRSTFGNKDVRNGIKQYHGSDILDLVDNYINWLAAGSTDVIKANKKIDKAANTIRKNFTLAILAKPNIGLKQLPSVMAFASDMSFRDYSEGVVDFWRPDKVRANYDFLMENSAYLRERFGGGFERDIKFQAQKPPEQMLTGKNNLKSYLLYHIRIGDRAAVLAGVHAKYKSGIKAGLSHEQALLEAELLVEATQPTSTIQSLSALQNGGPFMKLFTMFQNQPNKYFRIISNNMRNFQRGRGSRSKAVSNIALAWVVLPAMFQFIADGFEADREHQLRAAILGPINDLLVFGQAAEAGYNWFATDEKFEFESIPATQVVNDTIKGLSKAGDLTFGDSDSPLEDLIDMINYFAKAAGYATGLPTPYAVQIEGAIRSNDYRQLVFSPWTLEADDTKKQSVVDKVSEADDLLGSGRIIDNEEAALMAQDIAPGLEYRGDVYNLRWYVSRVQSAIKDTDPSDITEANGFSPLAVAVAEWTNSEAAFITQPTRQLYKINHDDVVDYTYRDYWNQWQARLKITDPDKLKEFDSLWPDAHLGNFSTRILGLLDTYHSLTTEEEQVAFLEKYPSIAINPSQDYLINSPEDNAKLFMLGKSQLLTMDAYEQARAIMDTHGIPDELVGRIPPDNIAEAYFGYQETLREFSSGSSQAKLFRIEHPDMTEWLGLEMPDNNPETLRINIEFSEQDDIYDGYADIAENTSQLNLLRETYLMENPEYQEARWKRYAYSAGLPEQWMETYLQYKDKGYTGAKRSAWLRRYYDFYLVAKDVFDWGPLTSGGGLSLGSIGYSYGGGLSGAFRRS